MPISVTCSGCQKKYRIRDELAGKVAKCQCGQTMTVPQPAAPAPPSAPRDPFAGLTDEAIGQPSPLQPLATGGKRRRKKGINPLLILAIGGGSVVAVLLIAIVVMMLPGGDSSAANVRWSTPESVFEAAKNAVVQKDWATFYDTCSPESQREMTGMLVFPIIMIQMMPEQMTGGLAQPCKIIATKYGIDKIPPPTGMEGAAVFEEQCKRHVDQISDKRAFFVEVVTLFSDKEKLKGITALAGGPSATANVRAKEQEMMEAMKNAQLSDVTVSGDTAAGTTTTTVKGRSEQDTVRFVKIDGNWRVSMDKMPLGGPMS